MARFALTITSPHNPRIKFVVKLRDRQAREREGLMLVEATRNSH